MLCLRKRVPFFNISPGSQLPKILRRRPASLHSKPYNTPLFASGRRKLAPLWAGQGGAPRSRNRWVEVRLIAPSCDAFGSCCFWAGSGALIGLGRAAAASGGSDPLVAAQALGRGFDVTCYARLLYCKGAPGSRLVLLDDASRRILVVADDGSSSVEIVVPDVPLDIKITRERERREPSRVCIVSNRSSASFLHSKTYSSSSVFSVEISFATRSEKFQQLPDFFSFSVSFLIIFKSMMTSISKFFERLFSTPELRYNDRTSNSTLNIYDLIPSYGILIKFSFKWDDKS